MERKIFNFSLENVISIFYNIFVNYAKNHYSQIVTFSITNCTPHLKNGKVKIIFGPGRFGGVTDFFAFSQYPLVDYFRLV